MISFPLVFSNVHLTSITEKQIFTNADKIHAAKALSRLGLEDCFEGIICFETLNPNQHSSDDGNDIESEVEGSAGARLFDILLHFSQLNAGEDLPKTPVLCKPSEYAFEQALRIANINPHRTVRRNKFLTTRSSLENFCSQFSLMLSGLRTKLNLHLH